MEPRTGTFDQLPSDALRIILEIVHDSLDPADKLQFALYTASVCRSWREAVVCTPVLWSTVGIKLADLRERSVPCLQACLTRSRMRPLSISISASRDGASTEDTPTEELDSLLSQCISLMLPHVQRWRDVAVIARDMTSLQTLVLDRMHGTASLLRTIYWIVPSLARNSSTHGEQCVQLPSTFKASNLRQLVMDCQCMYAEPTQSFSFDQHFPSLESLTLRHPHHQDSIPFLSVYSMMKTLASLNGLRFLHFDNLPHLSDGLEVSALHFPSLEALECVDKFAIKLWSFLSFISAPRLSRVRAVDVDHERGYGTNLFSPHVGPDVLSRSFPSLTTFEICTARGIRPLHAAYIAEGIDSFIVQQSPFRRVKLLGVGDMVGSVTFMVGAARRTDLLPWHFPLVTSVRIVQKVATFRVASLRRIVQNRRAESDLLPSPGEREVLAVDEVHVHTDLAIGEEDRRWFQDNLSAFSWAADAEEQEDIDGTIELGFTS